MPKTKRFPKILAVAAAVVCLSPQLSAAGFSIIGTDPGSWPQILSSVGHRQSPAVDAKIFVGRPGAPASPNWAGKLATGCILVLEGESPLAASFGFRPGKETVRVASLQDVHRPNLPIVFEKPLEVHRYDVPAGAEVFATERWSGAPLIAGVRRGPGAILWIAADPGKTGYERFPYICKPSAISAWRRRFSPAAFGHFSIPLIACASISTTSPLAGASLG